MTARILLTGIAATALLAGCAVTKIDVDVYKGPLANHEHVQDQQLAVMATAAKPLLFRLQQELRARHLWKEEDRVTAILTLYDDNVIKGFENFIAGIERGVDRYSARWDVLTVEADPLFWSRIYPAMRTDLPVSHSAFRTQYRNLLDPAERPKEFRASSIADALKSAPPISILHQAEQKAAAFPDEVSSNSVFKSLLNEQRIQAHAKILFPDDRPEERNQFVAKTKAVAYAFNDTRRELRQLWTTSIKQLQLIHAGLGPPLNSSQHRNVTGALATYIAELTQPRFLAHAICKAKLSTLESELIQRSRRDIWIPRDWNHRVYAIATDSLAQTIREKPELLGDLIKADEEIIQPNDSRCPDNSYMSAPDRTEFGIVRGPLGSDELSKKDVIDAFRRLTKGAAQGLEEGRVAKGLTRSIEEYLELAVRRRPNATSDEELRQAQDALADTLVQFAHKVLALADNDVLFQARLPAAQRMGGDRSTVSLSEPDPVLNSYVIVLQAVGNTVLIQTDELRHRQTHKKRLIERAPMERTALNRAIERGGPDYIAQLIADLWAEAKTQEARQNEAEDAKAKADRTVTALEGVLAQKEAVLTTAAGAASATKQNVYDPVKAQYDKINAAREAIREPHASPLKQILPPTNPATATAIIDFVTTTIRPRTTSGADYLATRRTNSNIADGPPATVFDAVVAMVDRERDLWDSYLKAADKEWQKIVADETQAKAERNEAKGKLDAARQDAARKATALAEATRSEDNQAAAAKAVEDRQAIILTRASSGARVASATQAHEALRAVLGEAQRTAAQGTSEADKTLAATLQWTIDYIAKRRSPPMTPPPMPPPAVSGREENARDVLDQLIAALRHEHILAVRDGGADSDNAKRVEQSIKAAYDHRSGMAYIRPSSAYLRSSYAATALQQDAGLAWQNLLTRAGERSSPLFSESLVNDTDQSRLRIVGQLDKQFWQNINSVRVSGAGLTNYVMAKDDIGNWYVKAYSSDPKAIIQSARNLALFNLGATANVNFLSKGKAEDARERGETVTAAEDKTPLERLFDKHRGAYAEKTNTDLTDALALDKALSMRVAAAWDASFEKADRDKLTSVVNAASSELEAELTKLKADTKTDPGLKIAAALQHGRRFYQTISSKVDGVADFTTEKKALARKEAARVSRNALDDFVRRRQSATRDYEQSLTFIGEASK